MSDFSDVVSISHPANLAADTIALMDTFAALRAAFDAPPATVFAADHAFEAAYGQYLADVLGTTTTMHDLTPGTVIGPGNATAGGWVLFV